MYVRVSFYTPDTNCIQQQKWSFDLLASQRTLYDHIFGRHLVRDLWFRVVKRWDGCSVSFAHLLTHLFGNWGKNFFMWGLLELWIVTSEFADGEVSTSMWAKSSPVYGTNLRGVHTGSKIYLTPFLVVFQIYGYLEYLDSGIFLRSYLGER